MAFRAFRLAATLVIASAFAGAAQAQTDRMHFGPRLSYQFDLEEFGIGAQLGVPLARHLEFYPSFDYFFVDPGSFWNLNADLKYRFLNRSANWLYAGAGLNIARRGAGGSHDTGVGFNLLVGAEPLTGRVHPFGELRFTANDGSTGMVAVGLNFTLGRH